MLGMPKGGSECICLLCDVRLFKLRYVRYFIDVWCMTFMDVLIDDEGICRLPSSSMYGSSYSCGDDH